MAVGIEFDDATLRLALTHVVERAGHRVARRLDLAELIVTADPDPARRPVPQVIAVAPIGAACQLSLRAVREARARAVVCADDPQRLTTAMQAVADGWTTVDQRAISIAATAPRLDTRSAEVLQLLLRGATNQQLATRLSRSMSTVKRDVAGLFEAFDAASRLELVARARALGFGLDR